MSNTARYAIGHHLYAATQKMESPDLDGASREWDYKKLVGLKSSRPSLNAQRHNNTCTPLHAHLRSLNHRAFIIYAPTNGDTGQNRLPKVYPPLGIHRLLDRFPCLSQKDQLSHHLRENQSFFVPKSKNNTIMGRDGEKAHSLKLHLSKGVLQWKLCI